MVKKIKLLVSACLLGEYVRYDGRHNKINDDHWKTLQQIFEFVSICPEVLGGLPIPRNPCEIQQGSGTDVLKGLAHITQKDGINRTHEFMKGALQTLEKAQSISIRYALLKSKSPSCGNTQIYNGQFSGQLIDGSGVTAAILIQNGIKVFNETQINDLVSLVTKV